MFHSIPPAMLERMKFLETRDTEDRNDGTPRMQRLRQIPPETGKFLALLAAGAPEGDIIEVGASAGYSTLWLALAAQTTGRRVTTFEVLPEKVELARETFRLAGVDYLVELIADDARKHFRKFDQIAFCFLDAEKEIYGEIYELVIPRLVKGGLLVADNAINHRTALQPMLERALTDERVDAVIVPIGKGELVCRKQGLSS
jgi:caffeoyl-CoA O-methyltransferase